MRRLACLTFVVTVVLASGACQGRPTIGDQACPDALLEGTLVEDAGTLLVETPRGGTQVVLWPDGVTVAETGSGLVLVGFFGQTIAREGDFIKLGGGYSPGDTFFQACGEITAVGPGQ